MMVLDQAKRLRELMLQKNSDPPEHDESKSTMNAQVIAIASGKGGVGKSNFSINMAIQMRKLGKRVVIIDADFGLANVEILLGIVPKHTVADVINGVVDIEAALTTGPLGCMFLSGGSGMSALTDLTDNQILRLTDGFLRLDALADYIIIDTRAGLSNAVTNFIKAASDTIVVTTPDPTAIADAYALIKSVKATMPDVGVLKLVVNCAVNESEANDVYDKLNGVSARFLGIKLLFLGCIPFDSYLVRAVRKQKPVSIQYPFAESANKYSEICAKLLKLETGKKSNIQNFVLKLIGRFGA
ncbi:MAG: MinD/ParA family protein [Defluviitaleaceae bacterium]|nr:MinD/ParA family protein [Defluviitaleaceae bacterium]